MQRFLLKTIPWAVVALFVVLAVPIATRAISTSSFPESTSPTTGAEFTATHFSTPENQWWWGLDTDSDARSTMKGLDTFLLDGRLIVTNRWDLGSSGYDQVLAIDTSGTDAQLLSGVESQEVV